MKGLARAIAAGTVTRDRERLPDGANRLGCSRSGQAIIDKIRDRKRPVARHQGGQGPHPAGTASLLSAGRRFCEADLAGLQAFRAGRYVELDPLSLFQTFVSVHFDGREVCEDVITTFVGRNKTVTFGITEPLNDTCRHDSCILIAFFPGCCPDLLLTRRLTLLWHDDDPSFGSLKRLSKPTSIVSLRPQIVKP